MLFFAMGVSWKRALSILTFIASNLALHSSGRLDKKAETYAREERKLNQVWDCHVTLR